MDFHQNDHLMAKKINTTCLTNTPETTFNFKRTKSRTYQQSIDTVLT